MTMIDENLYKQYTDLIKTGEGFEYALEIQRPAGEIDAIYDWCKANFEEGWRWQILRSSSKSDNGRYIFFFHNRSDYLTFVLKYG